VNLPGFDSVAARARFEPLLADAGRGGDRLAAVLESEYAASVVRIRTLASWGGSGEYMEHMVFGPPESESPIRFRVKLLVQRPLLWRSVARECALWQQGWEIFRKDGPTALAELDALVDANREGDAFFFSRKINYHVYLQKMQKRRLAHRARLGVARVGLAALEYRAAHGDWPVSLEGVPVDPFTREPFELVREGNALRIEAAVPWLDKYEGEWREDERIYWTLRGIQ